MTRNDDIERVLEQWFSDGPRHMSDRLFDGTLDRIDRLPRGRIADLKSRLPAMNRPARAAAAAAMAVVLAGIGLTALNNVPRFNDRPSPAPSVSPGPSVGPPRDPSATEAALQSMWEAVGDRESPGDWGATDNSFTIGATGLRIEQLHGYVLSSWSLTDDGSQIVVRFQHGIIGLDDAIRNQQWTCELGTLGTYSVHLSEDGGTLTLGLVSDLCAPRAAFLAGDWTRSSCPWQGYYSCAPEPSGDVQITDAFDPFGPGSSGRMSYVYPLGHPQTESELEIRFAVPEITVFARAWFERADKCGNDPANVKTAPAAITNWLATFPGLVVSTPVPVDFVGLNGLALDVSLTADYDLHCGMFEITMINYQQLQPDDLIRFFLLDRRDGQTVVIALSGQTMGAGDPTNYWMPMVEQFTFAQ